MFAEAFNAPFSVVNRLEFVTCAVPIYGCTVSNLLVGPDIFTTFNNCDELCCCLSMS